MYMHIVINVYCMGLWSEADLGRGQEGLFTPSVLATLAI